MLEDMAVDIYEAKSGNKVERTKEHFKDKVYPWMLANVDGRISTVLGSGILEVKCPSRDTYYRMKADGIPDAYILQGQHYMYVTQAEHMDYAIFCADAWDMEIVPVERDDNLINKIIEQEKAFWENVMNEVSPERLDYGDSRCKMCDWRIHCWKEEWNETDFEFIKNSAYEEVENLEFECAMIEHKENLALAKRAEALVDKTKRLLTTYMGEMHKVQLHAGKISLKWEVKTYYNTKKLFKDHPDLAKEYSYENGNRSLRTYFPKEKK
jgi:predicted phage-related endonuclease